MSTRSQCRTEVVLRDATGGVLSDLLLRELSSDSYISHIHLFAQVSFTVQELMMIEPDLRKLARKRAMVGLQAIRVLVEKRLKELET